MPDQMGACLPAYPDDEAAVLLAPRTPRVCMIAVADPGPCLGAQSALAIDSEQSPCGLRRQATFGRSRTSTASSPSTIARWRRVWRKLKQEERAVSEDVESHLQLERCGPTPFWSGPEVLPS
jgi:hypothetical protein